MFGVATLGSPLQRAFLPGTFLVSQIDSNGLPDIEISFFAVDSCAIFLSTSDLIKAHRFLKGYVSPLYMDYLSVIERCICILRFISLPIWK